MEPQSNNKVATTEVEESPKRKINKRFLIVFTILILVGGSYGVYKYMHAQRHEETDDAQLDASIAPVIPRVPGYIATIYVHDNQQVHKGDTLLVLDDRDLKLKVDQAEAALLAAQSGLGVAEATTIASRSNISTTQANVATADAQIEAAKVNVWRTTQDYQRYSNLVKDHSITQQQYELALAAKQTAEKQLTILQQQRNAAAQQTSAASSQSNATASQINVASATIKQRQVDVENARLNLSYTVITAPSDGLINKVNVQPGQFVQAGQAVFSIVTGNNIWVTANFKETQLSKMKEGQRVTVHVDAFPDKDFEGKVVSFSPATGSRFSVLPPDNASGNFVKVVQRLPVRIEFADMKDERIKRLRPGMNVSVDVHVAE